MGGEQPTQEEIDEHHENVTLVAAGFIPVVSLVIAGYGPAVVSPALVMVVGSVVAQSIAAQSKKAGTPLPVDRQRILADEIGTALQETYLRYLNQAGIPTFDTDTE